VPFNGFAQDITGAWAGYLLVNDIKVPYELVISGEKKNLSDIQCSHSTLMELKCRR
jgi:hypothetical protein